MKKEIYKSPFNGRTEDEIKIFLSDQIGEKVVSIYYRNGQIFCLIKEKTTSKSKEIILAAAIIFGALLVTQAIISITFYGLFLGLSEHI